MMAPSAMLIEAAAQSVKGSDNGEILVQQDRELTAFGGKRAQALGASGLSDDFRLGYMLGLATARTALRMQPRIVQAGLNPGDLL